VFRKTSLDAFYYNQEEDDSNEEKNIVFHGVVFNFTGSAESWCN